MQFIGPVQDIEDKCEAILRSLPEWFGIEEALIEYVADTRHFPTFAVKEDEEVIGFITVREHFASAWEIHCLGVQRARRKTGVGRMLIIGVEQWLATKGTKYLQIKTIAESHPSLEYAETRAFYTKMGYEPIEVFNDLWGAHNPCLQMMKAFKT